MSALLRDAALLRERTCRDGEVGATEDPALIADLERADFVNDVGRGRHYARTTHGGTNSFNIRENCLKNRSPYIINHRCNHLRFKWTLVSVNA